MAGGLAEGVGSGELLGERGRLGARLILPRATEEGATTFPSRRSASRSFLPIGSGVCFRPFIEFLLAPRGP